MDRPRDRLDGKSFWSQSRVTLTAAEDLPAILGSVTRLGLQFWRENMFFMGARDEDLGRITEGRFPARAIRGKTHPVFSLQALPHSVGFKVCPCSSKRPYEGTQFRYIVQGCRLRHTEHVMDRDSFLIEAAQFNIPGSMAGRLQFMGEVPRDCLRMVGTGEP